MKTVEFTKKFLTGHLKGLEVVERLTTSFPEQWYVGKRYVELFTKNEIEITKVVVE